MGKRILVTGAWHETNTFSAVPTEIQDFRSYQFALGDDVLTHHAGTNTEIGGMMEGAAVHGFDLQPAMFAGAVPSGLITRQTFEHIVDETCMRARKLAPLDGALVALHGAMAAEGAADADAIFLDRLRTELGADCPTVVTFDIHANLSPALFERADTLIGYDTYPHVDMGQRGREAAAVLSEILGSGALPAKAYRKLPLLTVPQVQATAEAPMKEVIAVLHAVEASPGVRTGSVAVGFPYADVPHLGVAVVVYGDDAAAVERGADRTAEAIWQRRHDLAAELAGPREAVARSLAAPSGPVILVDVADNVGGGAPGDGTVLLQELLDAGARGSVVVIWDPDAAGKAVQIGVDGDFRGPVGGRTDGNHGPPVKLEGTVRFAAPVTYQRESSYMTGQRVDLGRVGVIEAGGVRVVVTENRAMPFDSAHLRAVGIVPEEQHVLVVKSAIAWRAGFGEMAAQHIYVDTPGICASNLDQFAFTRLDRPFFPLQDAARWPS